MNNHEEMTAQVEHKDLTAMLDQEWRASENNEFIKRLKAGEDLAVVIESLPEFKEAFKQDLDVIDCSDGRVLLGKKIGLAGSGILLSDEELEKFITANQGKIKIITSHEDCGAAKIKFKQLQAAGKLPEGITTADELGTYSAQKLADRLGAEHYFLPIDKMAKEVHNERAIVVDGTGHFNSTNLKGFPPHFVCSGFGFGLSSEYMQGEITTLAGIALGGHGLGERFQEDTPFYVMVAARDSEQLRLITEVATAATKDFGVKVVVKGFLAPTQD
jgi:hypothetical protein